MAVAMSKLASKSVASITVFVIVLTGIAIFSAFSLSYTQYGSLTSNLFRQSVSIQRSKKTVAEVKLAQQEKSSDLANSLSGNDAFGQSGAVAQTTFIFQSVNSDN